MGVPRNHLRHSLDQLYDYLDAEFASLSGGGGGPDSDTITYPFTLDPASNVTALAVTGHNGDGTYGGRNIAMTIASGGNTNNYDTGLQLIKNQNSASVLEIYDGSTAGATGDYIRVLNNLGSPSVPQKTFYMANDGGLYTRTEIICSGVYTGDGGYSSSISPPSLELSMIGIYNDVGGPSIQCRTGNTVGGYILSAMDNSGNVLMSIRGDGSLQWGKMSQFTASVTTGGLMTVTSPPSPANLAVGMEIQAPGLPIGTHISSLGTGTGGNGTYNLSASPASAITSKVYFSAMDIGFGREAANTFRFGMADSALPQAQTIQFQNGVGSNIAAAAQATIIGPLATGNAINGDIVFKTGVKGSSGSGAPTQQSLLTLKGEANPGGYGGILIGGGGNSVPQITFEPNSGTTMSLGIVNGGSQLIVFEDTTPMISFQGSNFVVRSDASMGFANTTTPTTSTDTVLYRSAAGILGIGTTAKNGNGGIAPMIKAGAFVASDVPSGSWAVGHDTSGGTVKVLYNNAGTLLTAPLA